MSLSQLLQISYHHREEYPENLVLSGTAAYSSKLQAYRKLLDDAESNLCLVDGHHNVDNIFDVPIIDLQCRDGKVSRTQYIHSPAKLTKWIGVTEKTDPNDPAIYEAVATIRDPKCRFIYLYSQHSRDRLKITRSSLTEILTYHQIMPVYLDFMLLFGAQDAPKDLRFSGLREQINLKTPNIDMINPWLGRSGRHFQLCYNLKSVRSKSKSSDHVKFDDWSIRQVAIYHKFDIETGSTLWLVTKGGTDLLDRYGELVGDQGRPEDRQFSSPGEALTSSLSVHLMCCHWSTEDWRWYIRWLEEVIEHESGMAVHGPRGEGFAHKEYRPYDIQDLQFWQDRANEAVMVLEANTDILKSILKFYSGLMARKDFPLALKLNCEDELLTFNSQVEEIISDFNMQTSRAKLLVNIISDRKELVLQHLQGQAAERTEQLNRNLEREAVVMRIVTIVTLLYLPATFTSTFFSTDVVKYQDQGQTDKIDGNGSFSELALKRWLQVTIPLTALTLLVAWSTYRIYDNPRNGVSTPQRIRQITFDRQHLVAAPKPYNVSQSAAPQPTATTWSQQLLASMKSTRSKERWPRSGHSLPLHKISQSKADP